MAWITATVKIQGESLGSEGWESVWTN